MKSLLLKMTALFLLAFAVSCATAGKENLSDGKTVYMKTERDLKQKDVIEGYIVDSATGKGIRDAVVEVKNANLGVGYYRRVTDGKGYFRIDDFIKQIRYAVEVTAEGYVTYQSTENIASGEFRVSLDREGVLRGTVRDSAGRPLKGVEIKLAGSYTGDSGEEGEGYRPRPLLRVTDDKGDYVFEKLRETSYVISFGKAGYIAETAHIKTIRKGETFTLPMMMIRPASLSGKIIIQEINVPAINVNVTLKGRVSHSTATYQDGSYRIEDVKPGNYRVQVAHQGFYTIETQTIVVREGEMVKDYNFTVKPKQPAVSVSAYRYTFSPGAKVEFNMKTFRLEKVRAAVYRVPMGVLLGGRVDPNGVDPAKEEFKKVLQWDESIRNFEPYEWRYQTLEPNKPLPTGGYCIEISGADRVIDRKFFTVTSVGVVVKRSRESVFAYVTNLVDNRPVKGASIVVFDNTPVKKEYRDSTTPYDPPLRIEKLPVEIIQKGKTDADGVFHYKLKSSKHLSLLAIGNDGSFAFCSTGSPFTFKREISKYFIYTDRPVYRAGDTVHYKIIGKKREGRFRPLAGTALHYKISNISMDQEINRGQGSLDEWGTFSGMIKLDENVNLGEFEIRAGEKPGDMYGAGRFYVEQYRKPEFRIEITPSKDYYANGDMAEFKVEAKYFFGAPLKGALVKYRFYETRLRDTDTSYWWEEDYGADSSYNRIKLEGDRYVDENGIAVLRLACGSYPYDREITLETTIIDKSNVSITSRRSVKVGRGEFYIKINPAQNFFADDEKKIVTLKTMTYGNEPVRATMTVLVFRYIWKPWQRVYVHDERPVFEQKITTDGKGEYRLELPKKFDLYGEFDIVAAGVDKRENRIEASRVIWIYSGYGARMESRFGNLELSVNTGKLDGPQEITCLVKSRFPDAWICLTLEGRDVYESRVIRMKGNVMPVKFGIKAEYAPNLFLTATMQRSRALFTSSAEISLPNPDTALRISIEPDKKQYLPGEKARITLKVTDGKGRPLKADLSLGAVDEAIYQIRPDHTPKMADFFYTKISNWVMTNYSYPITILAGAGKDGKVKVREKFEDTAFWRALIKTDEKGIASLAFHLPDNLTTWRLTVRGHDRDGRVGERRDEILVTQDLVVRIGKPRFLVEGDRVGLIGIVNSNTKRGLSDVKTEFRIDGAVLAPDEKLKISLPSYGSARLYYAIQVPEGKDSMQVYYEAIADREARDALKISIPVQSRGSRYKFYGLGDMAFNKSVELRAIEDTDDFTFQPEELVISANPGPIAKMLKASRYLTEYPYGCIEQTVDRFLPVLAMKKVLEKKGLGELVVEKKLEEKAREGLERIQRAQNDDGSWGWWAGDRGNEFLTGYVLYCMRMAEGLGYAVDKNVVSRGNAAVARMLQDHKKFDDDAVAYMLYIHALYGGWSEPAFARLADKKELNPYQAAFFLRALARASELMKSDLKFSAKMDKKTQAHIAILLPRMISRLKEMQKKDGRGIYWESLGGQRWGWQGGDAEITAHVLSALLESGDRTPVVSQAVNSLSKRGRGEAWSSTKETAAVFFSFCRYLDEAGGDITGAGRIDFRLDGEKVAVVSYDLKSDRDLQKLTSRVKIDKTRVKRSYRIDAEGTAGPDVSFDLTLSGSLYYREKGMLSFLKSEERGLKELANGMDVVRGFYTLLRVRDVNNNEYLVPQDLSGKNVLRVGDEIMVRIKFKAQDDFEYLVLEDYLPSGFEVVSRNAYDEYQPYSHQERWDNRMVFFFTKVRKGEVYEVAYIIRAELPGEFIVKPARMECMYEPSIQGWSLPARFRVEKK